MDDRPRRWNMRARPVFMSARAQAGNLGDLILRRYVTDAVQSVDGECHVLVEGASRGLIQGLELGANSVVYETVGSWMRGLLAAQIRGRRATIVYTPGPETLSRGFLPSPNQMANVLVSALVRLSGGKVLKVGRSLSGGSVVSLALERAQARLTNYYSVRDRESRDLVQTSRITVRPDVAFAARLGIEEGEKLIERSVVAFSFREDRKFDYPTVGSLIDEAREMGMTPVFLSQVRRDRDFNARLSKEFNVEYLDWPEELDEITHLGRILSVYSRAHAVVTNRLHALVFGLRCGAAPIGLSDPQDPKLTKTLRTVGLESGVEPTGGTLTTHTVNRSALGEAMALAEDEQRFLTDLLAQ